MTTAMSDLGKAALRRQYKEGLQDGVAMVLSLIGGRQLADVLPADEFEAMRYRGPIDAALADYLDAAIIRCIDERTESGR